MPALVLLLLACTDPEPVAIAACQALPGIAAHPQDLPLLAPLLTAKDMEFLGKAAPTRGLEKVSATTLAELRAQTTCAVVETNGAGEGRWAVKLTRTSPVVDGTGAVGAPAEQTFEWQVSDEEGGRVDLNLEGAAIARGNLDEAIDQEDWKRYASGWRALAARWPDPVLAVDVAAAEALATRMEYAGKLEHSFVGAGDGVVQASVVNQGDRAVRGQVVDAVFESAGGPLHSRVELGPLPAGATMAYQVAIPDGAEGSVRLRTLDLALEE
ncbi:hypothetical protein L6R53_30655 [Myxococcota bacterium]|nr:hypothetical protein [Myxococcota bacterium]